MYAIIVSLKNMYVLILNLVKTTLIRIGFVQFLQHAGLLATLKILNFPMCTVVEWGDFSRPLSACVAHFRILTQPHMGPRTAAYYIHHSSLVDYLALVIYAKKTAPPLFIAFSNWYGFLWPPRKISGCVSLAPRKHFFHVVVIETHTNWKM